MLVGVKLLHTAIWVFFNACLVLATWAGLSGRFDVWFWLPLACIAAECFLLFYNDWTCPLTPIAARYTKARHDAFDIYLPRFIARHNIAIYTTLFVLATITVVAVNLLDSTR